MGWLAGSIRNKILAVLVLGIALMVAGALYGFSAARTGLASVAYVNDTVTTQAIEAQALESSFKEQIQQWMRVMAHGRDPKVLEKSWKQFLFREREVRRGGEKLREAVKLPAARELLDKFLAAHADMGQKYRAGLESFKASGFDASKVDGDLKGVDDGPTEIIEDLVKTMSDESQAQVASARQRANRGLGVSLVVIAVATLAALLACAWLVMRTVVKPLRYAVSVVDRVASGDLTVEVKASSRDETGKLLTGLRNMRDGLAGAVSTIRDSAETVGVASKHIAAGQSDLSTRTEEQAASLEETAASMEELATAVRRNSESARSANDLTSGATQAAARGGEVMSDMVGTMSGITEASRRIGEIVGVIDSLAFQTNILALNAAVEAARAGDQGRGFAVVAAEVRALAQRSASAAKEIRDVIGNSTDRVREGTERVEVAGRTMQDIMTAVGRVTQMMTEIAGASTEQLSGIEQVSRTITQMDRVVQQNAGLVSEQAAAAEHLAMLSSRLMDSVASFRLEQGGDARPAPAVEPEEAMPQPAPHARAAHLRLVTRPLMPEEARST
jgi:methyl-accepting chemotaxis protein-1 (serine sensor receptor)